MAHLVKAMVLFTFGFIILVNLGNALEKKGPTPAGPAIAGDPLPAGTASEPEAFPESEEAEPRPSSVVRDGSYAEACAAFDPIARPEEVVDILQYASGVTGTPVGVLYAVWQKETGFLHGDGRQSGKCSLKSELARRDRDAGTDHWNAMLAMAPVFGWTERYGKDLERMTCSCTKVEEETGRKIGYGGCCGPFQFSGNEIAHQYAIPLRLDPMTFCGGALIAGWELKKHHDNAFKPVRRKGRTYPGRGTVIQARENYPDPDHAAWHAAMSRYYGGDTGGVYGRTAVAKWKQYYPWFLEDQKRPGYLAEQILKLHNTRYSLRKMRAARSFASNTY